MGGVVALRLAHLFPESLSALVALDVGWVLPPAFDEVGPAVTASLTGPDYAAQMPAVMGCDVRRPRRPGPPATLLDTMAAARQDILHSEWHETNENTVTHTPLEQLKVPALYVAAQNPLAELPRLRTYERVSIGQSVGARHFHQFEAPEQVNAMIERFTTQSVPSTVA